MATKTKLKHVSQWNTAGIGAGLVGAPLAAGEIDAAKYNSQARSHDRSAAYWRNDAHRHKWGSQSAPGPKFGQTTSTGYEASHDPGDASHHRKMAQTYEEWARKSGTKYPYVTNKLRNEASQRAYEHHKASGGGGFSGGGAHSGGPGSSRGYGGGGFSWDDIYDDLRRRARGHWTSEDAASSSEGKARTHEWRAASARRSASDARALGRVGAGVGLGVTALAGASIMHNNHKWREELHRRNKGKFAPTGAVKKNIDSQETTVEKNLSVEEIFSKARQMEHSHWAGAKHGMKVGAKVGAVVNGASGAVMGGALGGASHGLSGAAAGGLVGGTVGAAGGAVQGGALGGLVGAAVGKDVPKKRVRKNLEISVDDVFAAARGDEVSKALWNDVAEGAGKLGGKIGGGAKTAGAAVGSKAKNLVGGKPYVKDAFNATKDKFNSQTLGRRYTAVGAAGVAGGVGLGAAAQSRKPRTY